MNSCRLVVVFTLRASEYTGASIMVPFKTGGHPVVGVDVSGNVVGSVPGLTLRPIDTTAFEGGLVVKGLEITGPWSLIKLLDVDVGPSVQLSNAAARGSNNPDSMTATIFWGTGPAGVWAFPAWLTNSTETIPLNAWNSSPEYVGDKPAWLLASILSAYTNPLCIATWPGSPGQSASATRSFGRQANPLLELDTPIDAPYFLPTPTARLFDNGNYAPPTTAVVSEAPAVPPVPSVPLGAATTGELYDLRLEIVTLRNDVRAVMEGILNLPTAAELRAHMANRAIMENAINGSVSAVGDYVVDALPSKTARMTETAQVSFATNLVGALLLR